MSYLSRQLRVRVLEALEERAKQFRTYEDLYPFRIPHEPLSLDAIVDAALGEDGGRLPVEDLRSRTVLRMEWLGEQGERAHAWEAWVVTLPSSIMLYCDSDGEETRILASVKRGNAVEADGFFLELLAESRGGHFGIEMGGPAPDRVRTSVTDRDLLVDVFVELYEGTPAAPSMRNAPGSDFRVDVERWLERVLVSQPGPITGRKKARRLREERQ